MDFSLSARPAWARPTWPWRSKASGEGTRRRGLFCDYRELLKNIRTATPQVNTTELELLKPVFAAEVLCWTTWARKAQRLGVGYGGADSDARYNDKQSTIITTNYPDLPRARRKDRCRTRRAAKSPWATASATA